MYYRKEIIDKLNQITAKNQGIVGENPTEWAKKMLIKHSYNLPNKVLDRKELKLMCADENIPNMYCYLNIMAWGGQGNGPGGKKNALIPWKEHYDDLDSKITVLRKGEISRTEAFNLFCDDGRVKGLGPAYFTKLLYFFDSNNSKKMYIMDQWTTKPILMLTGRNIIRHVDSGPTSFNTGKNYELFCAIIEDLQEPLNLSDGSSVEEKLFSVGSIKKNPRGEFRQFVVDYWSKYKPSEKYSEELVDELIERFNH